jgi:5-methylcytosine-specific restriction endonuclease McrA
MTPRREFPKHVKLATWQRADGHCEKCTTKCYPGHFEYHHIKEDTFNGEPTLENCQLLCIACHSKITRKRAAAIAKSNRIRNREIGIKKNIARPLPGTRASGWKHKMDGTWERREQR